MLLRNWGEVLNSGRRINRKPFPFRLTLALVTVALAQARQQDRDYVFNGKILEAADGIPVVASTTRWQVWLFEGGAHIPAHTACLQYSRWGLLEGGSPEEVMRRLKNSQSFEQAYLNFFGPGSWGRYTFLNPLGPIAVTDRTFENEPATLEKLYQLRWLSDRVDKLIAALEASLENNESDPDSPVRAYFDQFRDAQQQVCRLYSQMLRNRPELRFISNGIAPVKTEITNAEDNLAKITSIWQA